MKQTNVLFPVCTQRKNENEPDSPDKNQELGAPKPTFVDFHARKYDDPLTNVPAHGPGKNLVLDKQAYRRSEFGGTLQVTRALSGPKGTQLSLTVCVVRRRDLASEPFKHLSPANGLSVVRIFDLQPTALGGVDAVLPFAHDSF